MNIRLRLKTLWHEIKLRARITRAAGGGWISHKLPAPVGRLFAVRIGADGKREDFGLISTKVVTDAGVAFIVDAIQALATISNFKYHASGTGGTAEAASQTALVTEAATRATGSQTEGASANIYRTVGTIPYTGTLAITEHGIFSAAAAGTMLDRSLFAAINVINGDSIEFTYDLTVPSGS